MEIDQPNKEKIVAAAKAAFPHEAVGVIAGGAFFEFRNTHFKPTKHFEFTNEQWDEAERYGPITLIWHSHPNGRPAASADDKTLAEGWGIPIAIYATPADAWDIYEPCGWMAPLTGRVFVYGIHDCWQLVRDCFKLEKGIDLPRIAAPHGWWLHKRDNDGKIVEYAPELMIENIDAFGFVEIEPRHIRPYDVPLMRVIEGAVSHCGVYRGDGHMLHHFMGHASRVIAYQPGVGQYGKVTERIVRHQSLA